MKHFRVSFEDTFCRDVFVSAETKDEANAQAREEDWNDDDWCDGHELIVTNVQEVDGDGEEI